MDVELLDGFGPPAGFYSYFLGEAMLLLPPQVIHDGMMDMYEAIREAGMQSLQDFARSIVPVLDVIEVFAAEHACDRPGVDHNA